jgi:hypothetical protein
MTNKKLSDSLSESLETAKGATANNVAIILNQLNVVKGTYQITEEQVELLGSSGVSVHNLCKIFKKSFGFLNENPNLLAAYEKGRATLGSKVRTTLVDSALENNNITAAIYLDRILSGDQVASEVNVNVTSSPLENVSTEDLLNVAFTVKDDETD